MALVESQVTGLELERVIPKVRTLFEREDKFYSSIEKRQVEKISNRQMRVPLELRPGGSFSYFTADGGDLGRGGGPTFDKAVLTAVFMAEAIEYTKLSQWATDDERKAVVSSVRRLTATALDEIRRQIDAQMQQNGSGQIGTITSVATAAGVDTYTCTTDGFGVKLMRFGQTIQVFDTTGVTLRGSGVITTYDLVNKKVSVTPSIAGAIATDIIVTNGISAPSSLQGLYGVPYHHSNATTGTWLGFTRSTTPEIVATGVNANSAALTLPLARLSINAIGNRIGMDESFSPVAWMHPCQAQAYESIGQLVTMIHKQPKDESLNLYFGSGFGSEGMQMAGAPVRTTFMWDKTRIDFVIKEVWGRAEILPIGFYQTDGRKTFEIRSASGGVATADIFYMVVGMQTFISNPPACSFIYTLQVPSGY
jgi:hypothetical protein